MWNEFLSFEYWIGNNLFQNYGLIQHLFEEFSSDWLLRLNCGQAG